MQIDFGERRVLIGGETDPELLRPLVEYERLVGGRW